MPIVRTGESAYDKELELWNTPKRNGGYAPDGYEPYPKMLYKAHRRENGKVMCMDLDAIYAVDPAKQALADAFNRTCQRTVNSDGEHLRAKADGWCDSPDAALAVHEQLQQDIATAAAEANHSVRSMSEKARAEFAAADADTEHPLTDVPKKRGPKVSVS
jgi:hypothetical protein